MTNENLVQLVHDAASELMLKKLDLLPVLTKEQTDKMTQNENI